MNAKVNFTQRVDPQMLTVFHEIAERLKHKNYDVLEAMIISFQALPRNVQRSLISADPEERGPALDALAALSVPPASAPGRGTVDRKGARRRGSAA